MENENLFQNTEGTNETGFNDGNLVFKIWFEPKATLQYILSNCPDQYVLLLFSLGGISRSINRVSNKGMGDNMSTASILIISIIAGGLFGWLSYYLYAWVLEVTGKWLNGNATFSQFKTILAWSSVPIATSLLLLIPELYIFGDNFFKSEVYSYEWNSTLFLLIFAIIEMILSIWSLVILIKGIGLVQNFTIGKSILNAILPAFLIFIPLFMLGLIIGSLH